jgi:hypothetical protein
MPTTPPPSTESADVLYTKETDTGLTVLSYEILKLVLWRAVYTPGDRLTSWVYSTTCCTVPVYKLLFIRQLTSAVVPLVVLASTMVTPIRLYSLYCTLYFCTLTHWQPSVPATLSSAFVSDFLFQVLQCALHRLQLSQHFFACNFV